MRYREAVSLATPSGVLRRRNDVKTCHAAGADRNDIDADERRSCSADDN